MIPPVTIYVSADNLIKMKDFDAIPDQGSALDIAPLFNCALDFARIHKLRAIYFSYGSYTFNTPPQAIDFPITIIGDLKGRTYLVRNYQASTPDDGLLTFVTGSGIASVRDLAIVAASSSSHGSAISLVADEANALGYHYFVNLYLSAEPTGNWDVTVNVNGKARQAEPIGIRDVDFQNCSVFGAAEGAILLDGVVAFNFVGGGVFQAGGLPGTSGKILVSPSYDGTSGLKSYYVNIDTTFVDGILIQASEFGHYSAYFSSPITTSGFSSDNIVIGTWTEESSLSGKRVSISIRKASLYY